MVSKEQVSQGLVIADTCLVYFGIYFGGVHVPLAINVSATIKCESSCIVQGLS